MKPAKNSEEAKDLMRRVREARQQKPKPPKQEGGVLSEVVEGPVEEPIDLPQNKFMLLLNLIMSIQDDIDYMMSNK